MYENHKVKPGFGQTQGFKILLFMSSTVFFKDKSSLHIHKEIILQKGMNGIDNI